MPYYAFCIPRRKGGRTESPLTWDDIRRHERYLDAYHRKARIPVKITPIGHMKLKWFKSGYNYGLRLALFRKGRMIGDSNIDAVRRMPIGSYRRTESIKTKHNLPPKISLYIEWFGVNSKYRGRGIGARFYKSFEYDIKKKDNIYGSKIDRIYLNSMDKATPFWRKQGFRFVSKKLIKRRIRTPDRRWRIVYRRANNRMYKKI